jgi:type VI secretion system secreted protein VgrG
MARIQATQENRPFVVETTLGKDVLVFHRMSAIEQLGRLFEYEIELLSNDANIEIDDVLGQNITVQYVRYDNELRYFNGYVSRFSQGGMHGELYVYYATLKPWLWFLTRTSDCRIFQEKSVPEIIEQIFQEAGFSDFDRQLLLGDYRTWEYCVQYRETDFNFISRLMEQEGIYYYFKHENGKHTMILADAESSHDPIPGYEDVPYYPYQETSRRERDYIHDWSVTKEIQPGGYALNDFDFENPQTCLQVKSSVNRNHAQAGFELYDYPGEFHESSDGEYYARVRIDEQQAQHEIVKGMGNVGGLSAGCLFNLSNYKREDQNREYLVTSASYELGPQEYESTSSGGDESGFFCSFMAIDSKVQFRAQRTTPKPVVQGPQTAIVVGKSGEEIWTDKYGRVKVQFHWDRHGISDENSSCWVRVAQLWAGKGWGGINIPRIGQEVIVEFLEGDPDRPIITGRVYNGVNSTPYKLPDHKTKSAMKSNSSIGGGGFNEIRFEDKKSEEQIYLHAEKNIDLRVKNDRFESIGHDRSLVVENDKKEHIKNERHEQVDSHHMEKIGADRNLKVEGKEAKEIVGSLSLKVSDDVIEEFAANHSEQVAGDYYIKASNIVIEGTTNVTVKVGQSYLAIEAGGIKIGTTGSIELEATSTLTAKGTAGVTIESPATTDVKGTMTTVSGDAVLTLEGGLVKIN